MTVSEFGRQILISLNVFIDKVQSKFGYNEANNLTILEGLLNGEEEKLPNSHLLTVSDILNIIHCQAFSIGFNKRIALIKMISIFNQHITLEDVRQMILAISEGKYFLDEQSNKVGLFEDKFQVVGNSRIHQLLDLSSLNIVSFFHLLECFDQDVDKAKAIEILQPFLRLLDTDSVKLLDLVSDATLKQCVSRVVKSPQPIPILISTIVDPRCGETLEEIILSCSKVAKKLVQYSDVTSLIYLAMANKTLFHLFRGLKLSQEIIDYRIKVQFEHQLKNEILSILKCSTLEHGVFTHLIYIYGKPKSGKERLSDLCQKELMLHKPSTIHCRHNILKEEIIRLLVGECNCFIDSNGTKIEKDQKTREERHIITEIYPLGDPNKDLEGAELFDDYAGPKRKQTNVETLHLYMFATSTFSPQYYVPTNESILRRVKLHVIKMYHFTEKWPFVQL